MRPIRTPPLTVPSAGLALALLLAPPAAPAQVETSRAVTAGGISVPDWTGRIDEREARSGQVLDNARFAPEGDGFHVTTGPAVTYWNPGNTASGDYTVRATFTEPKYMNLNNHPHPYGVVVAGTDMSTARPSYLYCATYGSGAFIVRGFGPEPFQMNGRRPEAHPAVHTAAGPGEPVTQEIAVSVRDGAVECAVNGTVVASYDQAEVVAEGRLRSTDGVYGLRFGHNTEAVVVGFGVERR